MPTNVNTIGARVALAAYNVLQGMQCDMQRAAPRPFVGLRLLLFQLLLYTLFGTLEAQWFGGGGGFDRRVGALNQKRQRHPSLLTPMGKEKKGEKLLPKDQIPKEETAIPQKGICKGLPARELDAQVIGMFNTGTNLLDATLCINMDECLGPQARLLVSTEKDEKHKYKKYDWYNIWKHYPPWLIDEDGVPEDVLFVAMVPLADTRYSLTTHTFTSVATNISHGDTTEQHSRRFGETPRVYTRANPPHGLASDHLSDNLKT